MKFIKKIAALLIITAIMISASGCNLIAAIINSIYKYPFDSPAYSERKYEEPDKDAIYAQIDEIKKLSESSGNDNAIKEKRTEFFINSYYKVSTSRTVAEIEYYKNINDEQAKKRYEDINVFFLTLHNDTMELEKTLFSSSYKKMMISITNEDYCNSILNYNVKDQTLLDLEAKESKLVSDYTAISSSGSGEKFAEIYKDLIITRNQIAAASKKSDGTPYKNYPEYAYDTQYGRDYTPDEIASFRAAIKQNFYDLGVKILSIKKSFTSYNIPVSENELKEYVVKIIEKTADDMLPSWNYMTRLGLYDFTVDQNKMNTSFVTQFQAYGDGFMFINASGAFTQDVNTVLHEFGHYNAIFATEKNKEGKSDIYNYDLLETHSQCFELITLPAIKSVCDEQLYETYTLSLLLNSVWAMLSKCMFDEFEYIVYNADPETLTQSFLENTFTEVQSKYWSSQDYKYYEVPHLFSAPSYCISYAVSMLFSSVIWNTDKNVNKYLDVVSYGEGHYLSEICEKVGLDNPLDKSTVEKIALSYNKLINETFAA